MKYFTIPKSMRAYDLSVLQQDQRITTYETRTTIEQRASKERGGTQCANSRSECAGRLPEAEE